MRSVIVICGGWSVSQYDVSDLRKRGFVIGVNESAVLQKCHVGLTMDRLWAEHRYQCFLNNCEGELYIRQSAAKNIPEHPKIQRFACDHQTSQMTMEPLRLNGTNSGMVALNLALQILPACVYVFGLDMQKGPNGEPYYHPPYEWANPAGATKPGKYKEWKPEFDVVYGAFLQRRVRLVQVNNRSTVKIIPSISYEEFLKETK